jgi:hypothetical protein
MKGILFSEEMFNLVVNGTKTQTRRLIKPQPDKFDLNNIPLSIIEIEDEYSITTYSSPIKPRYKAGEILYLKEPYCQDCEEMNTSLGIERIANGKILYKYNGDIISVNDRFSPFGKWQNKLFMPAKFARFFIEITNVRCENICAISDEDCRAEGVDMKCKDPDSLGLNDSIRDYYVKGLFGGFDTAKEAFAALFNSINGKNAFEQMQWVWVYTFRLVDGKP